MAATIWNLFAERARVFADRPLLCLETHSARVYGATSREWSYAEAASAAERLADAYHAAGCGNGLRVAVCMDNRPEFFQHFLALNKIGASIVPISAAMGGEETAYLLEHSEAALVVAARPHAARLREITVALEAGPIVVDTDLAGAGVRQRQSNLSAPDEAALLYTSGTTGRPKGCLLSNEYFLHIANLYVGLGGLCAFEPGCERIITPLPVTHMNALACSFMAAIESGGCLIQLDRFHPSTWWGSVRTSRASIMHYLGVMPAMLLNASEDARDNVGDQIKFAFGAGCDPRHQARFEERFGVPLIEAWAMTETGAGAWIAAQHEPRHVGARCFGRVPAGLEWRLVDEGGVDTPSEAPGELLVRRAGEAPRRFFFSGYLKDSNATEEAWADGWFHTGDVVRVDAEGNFYFVDRRKNVIRRSGENIAAIEVESVLMRHEGVAACAVAAVEDEIRGEEVAALIVAKSPASEELAGSIVDHALAQLAYFKAPGYVVFTEALPVTASEKVKRGDVKVLLREATEKGACHDFRARKKRPRVA